MQLKKQDQIKKLITSWLFLLAKDRFLAMMEISEVKTLHSSCLEKLGQDG